jgi:hypothetical protein
MASRLCLMRKMGMEVIQGHNILKNDPRDLHEHFLLHKMTELEISKKEIPYL